MDQEGSYSGGVADDPAVNHHQHYDEVFPALPVAAAAPSLNSTSPYQNSMRVQSSTITQVFQVPLEERRFDQNDSFGEKESVRMCAAIMKDTGASIEMSLSKDGSLSFLVSGKKENVQEARRLITSNFQTQASASVVIQKQYHKMILGKSGTRLKELEKATQTRISVPAIGDSSETITITGARENVEKAKHEINIISDEQSKKAFEKLEVDKELHPFIAGAYNEKVSDLMNQTSARIHIPPPSSSATEITIAGDKDGVEAARNHILNMVKVMKKKYTHVSIEVSKQQHKYVIGHKGSNMAEIMQDLGVSVEVPPLDSTLETITIRGPQDKLGEALSKVYEKANSCKTLHVNAPAWLHRFIIGKKGANIKSITQDYPEVHVVFYDKDKEERCTVEGPPDQAEVVQAKLNDCVENLLQQKDFTTIEVEPKYCKHIIGKNGSNVNRLKEQTGVEINIPDSNQNLIKIMGDKDGVRMAKLELENMINKMKQETERDIKIECKYHKILIGQKGDNIREVREMFPQVVINFPPPEDKSDIVKLRGPKDQVEKCQSHLLEKVGKIIENSFSVQVQTFPECNKFIIGKGGANIKKLREETNTQIEVTDGKNFVVITGRKENVLDAKDRIVRLLMEQSDMVTEEVSIAPKLHNALIGRQGKIINSIEEECGVKITFPPAESKSDKVKVNGSREGVDKATSLLLELASEKEPHNYMDEVRAKPNYHRFLIGKAGANIRKIRESTGTRIIFPSEKDEDRELITIIGKKEAVMEAKAMLEEAISKIDNIVEAEMVVDEKHHKHFVARRCEVLHQLEEEFAGVTISFPRSGVPSNKVSIKGPPGLIQSMKERIASIVKDLEERVTVTVEIPHRFHRAIMGVKGYKLQQIEQKFDVKINIPDKKMALDYREGASAEEGPQPCDLIRVTGKPENCRLACQALKDNQPITDEMDVPFEFHRKIIGSKGQTVRDLNEKYDVLIDVPGSNLQQSSIKITGAPACVAAAKEGVNEKIKEFEEERHDRTLRSFQVTIKVDPEYHPKIIGKRGSVVSKIKEDHGVQINIPRRGDPEEDIITIIGYEEKVNLAKADIGAIVDELNNRSKVDVNIDSRVHARLIGAKGKTIKKIMDKYCVEIKFPRGTNNENPNLVTISGEEENVLDCRDELKGLEEEYLDDVVDKERYQVKHEEARGSEVSNGEGFIVDGAPWDTAAPDVASTQDFPSFKGANHDFTSKVTWGPRR